MISTGTITYTEKNSFKFQIITTTVNETFTLPLGSSAAYTHNFIAYWGDTTSSVITAYNDADRVHTYATTGTYDIELIGTCQYFAFDNNGTYGVSKAKVYKLLAFTGNMGFRTLNFHGCTNLNTIVPLGYLKNLTTAYNMFNFTAIATVPAGLFDGCPNIAGTSGSFWGTFYNCGQLTTIPADLFRYNTKAVNFTAVFQNCVKLVAIPADLFRYNTLNQNFSSSFNNCRLITTIPVDLFRYNTLVYNFTSCFYMCYALTEVPADLFRYCTQANNFNTVFSDCTSLTTIPADIFKYNPTLHFTYAFSGCYNLTSIPDDLFRYNTSAWNFSYVFRNCSKITTIPIDLFRYNTTSNTPDFSYAFNGCTKAQLHSTIFCAVGEEDTRFLNKTVNFTNCFARTSFSGVQGIAPDLWNYDFGTGASTKTTCFSGAGNSLTSLSNYADIPVAWK
ncbi:MAG: hypothetical protein WC919_05395 [Candidatus Paceibacterota bacterium]|jgi:hypothetical protein